MLTGCFYLGPFFEASDRFVELSNDQTVVVGITHVTLADESRKNAIFWDHTRQVIQSLPKHKGYLGHKMRKKLFIDEAWTMTVWEDDNALNSFVRGGIHGTAMGKGLPAVKKARFVRLAMPRSQAALSWSKAEEIMKAKGRDLY